VDNSKAAILSAAVSLARRKGLRKITRLTVSEDAGIATGTVNYHFDTMAKLRDAVVAVAIDKQILPIIAEAITSKHRLAKTASAALRSKALQSLA
jgi:AcrR family transcriptional regulator